jgi:phosphate transport system permease protein
MRMNARTRVGRGGDRVAVTTLALCALVAVGILVLVIGYVLIKGVPVLSLDFLLNSPTNMGRDGGILPSIVGTLVLTTLSLIIAAPLGIGTALFLTEYTREGWFSRLIRFGTESLAGIPSIIFGLFGFLLFVIRMEMGWSILSGALTLSVMMLPTIVRTSEEALRAVPDSYREMSFSLGASRWQTSVSIVLPGALPGILTGVILAAGRAVGETAAVIFTAGSSLRLPRSILDPVRTLPVHFYILAREGISTRNAYGTAAVLLISILAVNFAAHYFLNRFTRNNGRE